MKHIKLNGKHAVGDNAFALVDDEDYDKLSAWSWKASKPTKTGHSYACRNTWVDGRSTTVFMHRVICSAATGMDVDHINHKTTDNRRCNLRETTRRGNALNRAPVLFSAVCKSCGVAFTLVVPRNGTKRMYCSSACRPSHIKTSEKKAMQSWRQAQGLDKEDGRS